MTLPRGVVDLAADLPPHDVSLLATTTSLLSREQTHPALRQLFAQSAQTMHSGAGWFNRARDFPNTRTSELPVSPEGDRAINGTPPFWQRYLPFWASNLFERMWLVLGGLLVLMLPLGRVVPPLYQFRVRSRVFRWYARLRDIEHRVDSRRRGDPRCCCEELDELESHGQQGDGAAVLCRRALRAAQQHLRGAQAPARAVRRRQRNERQCPKPSHWRRRTTRPAPSARRRSGGACCASCCAWATCCWPPARRPGWSRPRCAGRQELPDRAVQRARAAHGGVRQLRRGRRELQIEFTAEQGLMLRFDQIEATYELAHDAERGTIDPTEGLRRINAILAMPPPFAPHWDVLGHVLATVGIALILRPDGRRGGHRRLLRAGGGPAQA